jgi:putative endonuclease
MTEPLSTATKGARGEAKAAAYLESHGWTVLARNFRTRVGEIDLIVRRGADLAFVEVKAWESVPLEDLGRSVGPRKRARIVRAARLFLARRPELSAAKPRFDVVFLGGAEGTRHLADAFTEEGVD